MSPLFLTGVVHGEIVLVARQFYARAQNYQGTAGEYVVGARLYFDRDEFLEVKETVEQIGVLLSATGTKEVAFDALRKGKVNE